MKNLQQNVYIYHSGIPLWYDIRWITWISRSWSSRMRMDIILLQSPHFPVASPRGDRRGGQAEHQRSYRSLFIVNSYGWNPYRTPYESSWSDRDRGPMTRLPVLPGRKVVKALCSIGYTVSNRRWSHIHLQHPERPPLTIPDHKEIARGTLRAIIRNSELNVRDSTDNLIPVVQSSLCVLFPSTISPHFLTPFLFTLLPQHLLSKSRSLAYQIFTKLPTITPPSDSHHLLHYHCPPHLILSLVALIPMQTWNISIVLFNQTNCFSG